MRNSWLCGASAVLLGLVGAQAASAQVVYRDDTLSISADSSASANATGEGSRSQTDTQSWINVDSHGLSGGQAVGFSSGLASTLTYGQPPAGAGARGPWNRLASVESLYVSAFNEEVVAAQFASPSQATFTFQGTSTTGVASSAFWGAPPPPVAKGPSPSDSPPSSSAEVTASVRGFVSYTFGIVGGTGTVDLTFDTWAIGPFAPWYEYGLFDVSTDSFVGNPFVIGSNTDGEKVWSDLSIGDYTLMILGWSDVSASAASGGGSLLVSSNTISDATFHVNITTEPIVLKLTDDARAIPEFSTWGMLLIGFAGLAGAGWRRSAVSVSAWRSA